MALNLSIMDHEIYTLVCIVVLVVYLRLLLTLNMNDITKLLETHGFTTICYCLWLFSKCPYSHVARTKKDKILL